MQTLMELDYGWSTLDQPFVHTVVKILSSPSSLINVCRPATAILKKLVEAQRKMDAAKALHDRLDELIVTSSVSQADIRKI